MIRATASYPRRQIARHSAIRVMCSQHSPLPHDEILGDDRRRSECQIHRTMKFPLATGVAGRVGGVDVQIASVGSQKNAGPP